VGGEPSGKSLLLANLALALAAGKDRAGFSIPAARRVLVCQFELPTSQFVSRLARCADLKEPPPTKICCWTHALAGTCSTRRRDSMAFSTLPGEAIKTNISHWMLAARRAFPMTAETQPEK